MAKRSAGGAGTGPKDPVEAILDRSCLDAASGVPLYLQLAHGLVRAIEEGDLPPGTRLGNEIELARRLVVSRPTVRRAIEQAVVQGLLVRRRGAGTLVTPVRVSRAIRLTSLYEDLEAAGQRPTTRVLRLGHRPAPPAAAEALGLPAGARVLHIERLRFAGQAPIALMTNFHPPDVLNVSAEELEATGLYRLLRARGAVPKVATQVIGATTARARQARLLQTDRGAPLITMQRTAYDGSGRPIEFASHLYPADRYRFEMSLVHQQ